MAQNEPMELARIETFWCLSQIGRHRSNRNYWHRSNRNAWHKASEITGTIRTEVSTI
ncbi:hypothetical protein [Pricia antarctica]|uniref:hypothetical protein n=1 Tax=Pricia antarctica TaxID=641691 RepID=UPI00158763D2|nr:hypothetical protein [Pricia antarctica]